MYSNLGRHGNSNTPFPLVKNSNLKLLSSGFVCTLHSHPGELTPFVTSARILSKRNSWVNTRVNKEGMQSVWGCVITGHNVGGEASLSPEAKMRDFPAMIIPGSPTEPTNF